MVVKQFQDGGRPLFWKSIYRHYLGEKSSDFDEILYAAADFELYERHVIKNEVAFDRLRVRKNVFLIGIIIVIIYSAELTNSCGQKIYYNDMDAYEVSP